MKTWLVIALLCLISVRECLAAAPNGAEETRISGIRTIYYPFTDVDIVALTVWIIGGSAYQDKDKAGIERLTLSLLDKGSKAYSKDQISEILIKTGTTLTIRNSEDFSEFQFVGVKRHLDVVVSLMIELLTHPTFDEREFEQERRRLTQELRSLEESPADFLTYRMSQVFFAGHPYSSLSDGLLPAVEKLRIEDVRAYHQKLINPRRLLITVVGNADFESIRQKLEVGLSELRESEFAGVGRVLFKTSEMARFLVLNRKLPTNYVTMRFSGPSPADNDYPEMLILTKILDDIFFREVRTRASLSYHINASIYRVVSAYGEIDFFSNQPMDVLRIIYSEIGKLQRQPLPEKIVTQYVNTFLTEYYRNREKTAALSDIIGTYQILTGDWHGGFKFDRELKRVNAARVQTAAKRYLHSFVIGFLGNREKLIQDQVLKMDGTLKAP